MVKSLYIHLPFCSKKCRYCVFPTHIIGKNSEKDHTLFEKYLLYLKKEISLGFNLYQPISPLKTIYFGGGTPSLFPNEILKELTEFLKNKCHLESDYEWTLEINPEDLTTKNTNQIQIYKEMGFNRFSLGVQTFDSLYLKFMNRTHDSLQSYKAIEVLHSNNCNYSIDFIIDLPYKKNHFLDEEIKTLIQKLKPPHLSIYSLAIEPESYFSRKFNWEEGVKPLPTSDESSNNFIKTSKFLTNNGYSHYEISSFAKEEKFESKHNNIYWHGNTNFYGFGMGATSLLDKKRITRPKTLKKYFDYIDKIEDFTKILRSNNKEDNCKQRYLSEKENKKELLENSFNLNLSEKKTIDNLKNSIFLQNLNTINFEKKEKEENKNFDFSNTLRNKQEIVKKSNSTDFKDLLIEKEEGLSEFKVVLMGSLRTKKGLLWKYISAYKNDLLVFLENQIDLKKLMEVDDIGIRLKIPEGYLLCDEIVGRIYDYFEQKFDFEDRTKK